MFLLAGRCWHALTNHASEGKFKLNKANCKELCTNLSTRILDFMRTLACYVLNEMPIELCYEQMDAATPNSLLAQKMLGAVASISFQTLRNNSQQHATKWDRECKRTQHVHLTTSGVGGQQCCVRLHGALVTGAERTRPSELSWFLHYKELGTLKELGSQSNHELVQCFCNCMQIISEYTYLVFHDGLPAYLPNLLKSITRHIPSHNCKVLAFCYTNHV